MKNKLPYKEAAPLSEDELHCRIAAGDKKAFTQFFETWYPLLSTLILRITRSVSLTEEIVQDVFLKVWMSRETLIHVGNIKAFLWVMSRNMAIDAWRKAVKLELKQNQYLTESAIGSDEGVDIDYFTLLDKAVAQLPPQQQKVYLLSRRHRMKQEEIAKTMGISISTVKYYLQLSIAAITKQIKADAGLSAVFFTVLAMI